MGRDKNEKIISYSKRKKVFEIMIRYIKYQDDSSAI